jgi:hypothetical protein
LDGFIHPFFVKKLEDMCFAVLWIPTVNHVSIPFENPINGGEIDFDISDLDDESFIVKVKTSGRDIKTPFHKIC